MNRLKNKKITLFIVICVLGVLALISVFVLRPIAKYKKAMELYSSGQYEEAIAVFSGLENYKDSEDMIIECEYQEGIQLFNEESYDAAREIFLKLDAYKDCKEKEIECRYNTACKLMIDGEYEQAATIFEELKDYSDSLNKSIECKYNIGKQLFDEKEYESAIVYFEQSLSYEDSEELLLQAQDELVWGKINKALESKHYPLAIKLIDSLHNKDKKATEILDDCYSNICEQYYLAGLIDIAADYGEQVKNKSDKISSILKDIAEFNNTYGSLLGLWKSLSDTENTDTIDYFDICMIPKFFKLTEKLGIVNCHRSLEFADVVKDFNGKTFKTTEFYYPVFTLKDENTIVRTNEVEEPGKKKIYVFGREYKGAENNFTRCEIDDCDFVAEHFLWFDGKVNCYCTKHYNKIMDDSEDTSQQNGNSEDSSNKIADHQCEAPGCSREGTHSIIGLFGTTEYYCDEHFAEMKDAYETITGN